MTYTDEVLIKIKTMGILGYSPERITAILIEFSPEQIESDLKDMNSEIYKAYQAGMLERQMDIDYKEYQLRKKEIAMADMEITEKTKYFDLRQELFNV